MNAPQSRLDRAAIAARSDRDRGVLLRNVCAVGLTSDAPGIFTKRGGSRFTVAVGSRSRGESTASRPSVKIAMKIAAKNSERPPRDALCAV